MSFLTLVTPDPCHFFHSSSPTSVRTSTRQRSTFTRTSKSLNRVQSSDVRTLEFHYLTIYTVYDVYIFATRINDKM